MKPLSDRLQLAVDSEEFQIVGMSDFVSEQLDGSLCHCYYGAVAAFEGLGETNDEIATAFRNEWKLEVGDSVESDRYSCTVCGAGFAAGVTFLAHLNERHFVPAQVAVNILKGYSL